ncbi:MAG: type IV conjugative transfer system coupling protein TraD [Steroidobacteraceae bacterium]
MSNRMEGLLRPPIEYASAASYAAVAGIMVAAPTYLMMTPAVAWVTGAGLLSLAVVRFRAAWTIRRYQKGLRRLPFYSMPFAKLPVSKERLFLGKGFEWEPKHTQRLHDCEQPGADRYIKPTRAYQLARWIDMQSEFNPALRPLSRLTKLPSQWNPVAPIADVGGNPTIHGVGLLERERDIHMKLAERVGHLLVLGTTRVGKTRLAELIIAQDIARGDVVIVFDPKGDAALMKRVYREAKRAGRLDHLYIFHLGYPEVSARYNPVGQFTRITEVASRIAGQMPGDGQSQAFREFVWRYVNVISACRNALGYRPDIEQIKYNAENLEPLVIQYLEFVLERECKEGPLANWRKVIEKWERLFDDPEAKEFRKPRHMSDRSNRAMALCKFYKDNKDTYRLHDSCAESLLTTFFYDAAKFNMLVASLMPLLEKLCTGKCAELISPNYLDGDRNRPIFTWAEVIRTGGIVYVGLDALSDPEVAAAVGNSMFADLTSGSGLIYKHGVDLGLPFSSGERRVYIHADEFNELIGKEFIPLLNKAGGSGYGVAAYTQTWSDVIARLGNIAQAGQVAGNLNSLVMLRTLEPSTIEMLTKRLRQVDVSHAMDVSGSSDVSDPDANTSFTSRTEQRVTSQRVDRVHINDVVQLPKGQAFAMTDGGKLSKIRLPLPDPSDLSDLPPTLRDMADDMSRRYRSDANWYHFQSCFDVPETYHGLN